MKMHIFASTIFLIICLSNVHLLSLESSRRCRRGQAPNPAPVVIAPQPTPAPVVIAPQPAAASCQNVRYVRVLSSTAPDAWLQISQLVVHNENGVNVAKGKQASASSIWNGTSPATAVDGHEGARSHPHEFHANTANNAWWMVDLGNPTTVSDIVYYNRVDCCQNRIIGAKVQLLDSNKDIITEYTITSGGPKFVINTNNCTNAPRREIATKPAILPIAVPAPQPGTPNVRYVRVLSANKPDAWLQISQLVVRNGNGVNVAKGKPTSASSIWNGTSPATAVDGHEGPRSHPNQFHANTANNAWWMVDLGNIETVSEIVYYNRVDCCQDRIVGARVQLLDSNKDLIAEYTITSGAPKTVINTPFAPNREIATRPAIVPTAVLAPQAGTPNVRYVRVLSATGPDAWLQISQIVVHNGNGVNVAKGKPASGSSIWPGTSPATAVDGHEGARSHPHQFHANTPNNAWWMVDLGNIETVSDIVYFNRVDCCQNRIVGAKVQLLDSNKDLIAEYTITSGAPKTVINTPFAPRREIATKPFMLPTAVLAPQAGAPNVRYVKVLSATGPDAWLQISQIVVRNGNGVNVAKGKPTSASSIWPGTSPATAVDGHEGARSHPHQFHANTPNNAWWMVDLGNIETVSEIVYYNRVDCCQNRINGAKVQLLDSNKALIAEYTITSGGPKFVINCNNVALNREITTRPAIHPMPVVAPQPVPVVAPQPPVLQSVPLGRHVTIRNKASGKCITAEVKHGARYALADCNPNDNKQKFTIRAYNGPWWRIFAVGDQLVFDLAGQGQHDGNHFWNWPINNTPAQHFQMPMKNGYFSMVNQRSNKCAANPHGNVMDQRSCNGQDNQFFTILQ